MDTAAQRQKAYLGHGKGLQTRRLPKHVAGLVGDDYYERRKSYDPKLLLDHTPSYEPKRDRSRTEYTLTDTSILSDTPPPTVILSEEEKQKQVNVPVMYTVHVTKCTIHVYVHVIEAVSF